VTTGVGAGAAVETRQTTALIVKGAWNAYLGAAVVMSCPVVAGVTAWSDRTEAEYGVFGVSQVSVRSGTT
jgi:hypothetical protein